MFKLDYEMLKEYPWGLRRADLKPNCSYYETSGVCKHCYALEARENGCDRFQKMERLGIEKGRIIMSVMDGPGCRVLVEVPDAPRPRPVPPPFSPAELQQQLKRAVLALKAQGEYELARAVSQATGVDANWDLAAVLGNLASICCEE